MGAKLCCVNGKCYAIQGYLEGQVIDYQNRVTAHEQSRDAAAITFGGGVALLPNFILSCICCAASVGSCYAEQLNTKLVNSMVKQIQISVVQLPPVVPQSGDLIVTINKVKSMFQGDMTVNGIKYDNADTHRF